MSNEELKSNRYAGETIENEGLDYAVRHYISGDRFADPVTARLWTAAEKANQALLDHLIESGCDLEGI